MLGLFGMIGFILLCVAVFYGALIARHEQFNYISEAIEQEMENSTDITDAVEIVDE